ncbi:Reticulocyte-binding protein 2 like protein [Argiope bruennichi]|uniref:Reticulocyte-binding protein 2 like protein n=1 Tax=Argiope bruennichi TaxID=94029 RepID=A0A8T0FRQ7_ARGBR|nr:Reticulocyte-binding protein 2 like protein [Argiope bruennichi]
MTVARIFARMTDRSVQTCPSTVVPVFYGFISLLWQGVNNEERGQLLGYIEARTLWECVRGCPGIRTYRWWNYDAKALNNCSPNPFFAPSSHPDCDWTRTGLCVIKRKYAIQFPWRAVFFGPGMNLSIRKDIHPLKEGIVYFCATRNQLSKELKRLVKETEQKEMKRSMKETEQEELKRPVKETGQKELKRPVKKTEQEELKRPVKKTEQEELKRPVKTEQKELKKLVKETEQEELKRPVKTEQKELKKLVKETEQKEFKILEQETKLIIIAFNLH